MAEDWRVTVNLGEEAHTGRVRALLHEHQVEDEVRERLGKRVAVGGGGNKVFLYVNTEDAAREAQRVAQQLLLAHGMAATFAVDRWHHEEEEWEDASVPLPTTAEAGRAEHERLKREESADSQTTGLAEWEVRIELASHHDAHTLAQRLEHEGFRSVVRRWKYLLIGTNDHDDADALAKRLQAEVPPGATIQVEPGSGMSWELMPGSPFSVFGGLGA